MKILVLIATGLLSLNTWAVDCDYETVDSLIEKEVYVMAKRYNSKKVAIGVSINNGTTVTTSVAIFQGKGGNDGVKVDRIGTVTVDTTKCIIKNSLIGLFQVIELN